MFFFYPMGVDFWTSDVITILILIYGVINHYVLGSKKQIPISGWQLGLPLLLWIGMGLLSIFPAVNKVIAAMELIRMVRIFMIFVAIFLIVENREDVRFILVCLIVAFAVQAILIAFQHIFCSNLFRLPGGPRQLEMLRSNIFYPGGTMGHPSNYAKLAGLCLPICLAFMQNARRFAGRITFGAIMSISIISLGLTVSRAGILCSFFGLIWVLWLSRKTKPANRSLQLITFIIVFVSLGLFWQINADRILSRINNDHGSLASRPLMISNALNLIKDNPILGVGLNNYMLIAPKYDRSGISENPRPVHNIFLLYAAEIGILGAVCFIWFLIRTIRLAFKTSRQVSSLIECACLRAVGIGITCSWLQGLSGYGHRVSIVHLSYLAVLAGALAAYKCFAQPSNGYRFNEG